MLAVVQEWFQPQSVLDLGSGRGVWLDEWLKAGAVEVTGVDGDYMRPVGRYAGLALFYRKEGLDPEAEWCERRVVRVNR